MGRSKQSRSTEIRHRFVVPPFMRDIRSSNDGLYGEIFVKFDNVDSAKKAIQGLSGRWFGGQQVSATFISDALMQAFQ